MRRWIIPLTSLSAVVGALVLALFLAGVFDGDEASGSQESGAGNEVAGVCAQDSPDCDDTLVAPDEVDDDGAGSSISPVCAPGFPDCVDMIVVPAADDELEADR